MSLSPTVLANHVDVSVTPTMAAIQAPEQAANFLVAGDQSHVSNYARNGNDLILEFDDGKELKIEGFFAHGVDYNNLVFVHDDESRWLMTFDKALGGGDGIIDPLVAYEEIHGSTAVLLGLLGLGAAAGIAAVALDDDDDSASAATATGDSAPAATVAGDSALAAPSPTPAPQPQNSLAPVPPTYITLVDNVGPIQGNIVSGSVTDDAAPSLSGVVEPGSTVKIYDNQDLIGSLKAGAAGNWTFTPTIPLKDGAHTLWATATDLSGNESAKSTPITFVVDTTPPDTPAAPVSYNDDVVPVVDPKSTAPVTNDATPGINIGSGQTDTLKLYVDGKEVLSTYDSATGTLTPNAPQADGEHKITYTLTDAAGNESAPSGPITIKVDTETPDTPTVSAVTDNVEQVTGPLQSGGTTNDSTPTLAGEGELGSTVTVYDTVSVPDPNDPSKVTHETKAIGTATVGDDGEWTFTPETPLAEGEHALTTTLTDAAGNESASSAPVSFLVDTTAPDQPDVSHSGDFWSQDGTPTLSGENGEYGSTVRIYDNGDLIASVVVDAADGAWTFTPSTPLTEGSHTLSVTATDVAGNVSASSDPITIKVDTTPPGKPATPTSYVDNEGNVRSDDSTAPTTDDQTPGINIAPGIKDDPLDPYLETRLKLYVDGEEVPGVYSPWDGTLTPKEPLPEGPHQITYTLTDEAGNESVPSDPIAIEVDTTPPGKPATLGSYADDVDPVVNFQSKAAVTNDTTPGINTPILTDETPTLYVDGKEVDSTYEVIPMVLTSNESSMPPPHDLWIGTLTPTEPLPEGPHQITYTLTDAAGNESDPSDPIAITVDTTVPTQAVAIGAMMDDALPVTGLMAANGGYTNDLSPSLLGMISGPLGAGENLHVFRDGVDIGTATVMDINWGFADSGLVGGQSYAYTARVIDAAGNEGPVSAHYEITTLPQALAFTTMIAGNQASFSITQLANGDLSIAWIISGNNATDSSGMLYGDIVISVPPMNWASVAAVMDAISSNELAQTVFAAAKNILASVGLAETFSAAAAPVLLTETSDTTFIATGNDLASATDTPALAKPAVPGAIDDYGVRTGLISNGGTTDDSTPTFFGSGEPGSTITIHGLGMQMVGTILVEVVGTTVVDASGQWSFTSPAMFGLVSIGVTETDQAGNVSAMSDPLTFSIVYEPQPATAAITSYVDDQGSVTGTFNAGSTTDDTTPLLQGTTSTPLDTGESVHVFRDGVDLGAAVISSENLTAWTFQDSGLSNGHTYSYTARVVNTNGNVSTLSSAFTLTIDTPALAQVVTIGAIMDDTPPVTGLMANGGYTNDLAPSLLGMISGPLGASESLHVFRDGVDIGTAMVMGTNWTFTDSGLAGGQSYVYTAEVIDAAGNQGPVSAYYEITTLPQTLAFTTMIAGNQASFSITQLANGDLTIAWIISGDNTTDSGGMLYGNVVVHVPPISWESVAAAMEVLSSVVHADAFSAATLVLPTETSEYSDTASATTGNDLASASGGTETLAAVASASNGIDSAGAENDGSSWLAAPDTDKYEGTGGINVVDFKQAGDAPVTVDLSKTEAQDTGFGKATFSGINGLAGGSGNDTFTDNSGDNMFEGRGGNDTFNLIHGGHDTLVYKLLNAADATGGNGTDAVNGFTVGDFNTTAGADRIDVSKLLQGYTADADGPAHSVGGVATIDRGDSIADYLSVTQSGGNTTINIDRDGAGGTSSPTPLVTLNGVDADLATLLANHQLVV